MLMIFILLNVISNAWAIKCHRLVGRAVEDLQVHQPLYKAACFQRIVLRYAHSDSGAGL